MSRVINGIIHLPNRHHLYGDISIHTLLDETGYFDEYKDVGVQNIMQALIDNPNEIYSWLIYSDEKAPDSGWYIIDVGHNKYQVAYTPKSAGFEPQEYDDLVEACAIFIKQEIEDIRLSQ